MKTTQLTVAACAALFAWGLQAGPKNVILFIGDGMSVPQRMTAENFAKSIGQPTPALNKMPFQATTRTCSANALITDSAAAATAIACGEKTNNGSLGVNAKGEKVYSSATAAKASGRKVGIVTSVTINHATPGGFYAHRKSRGDGYGIGLDLLSSGFDYFAGGGLSGHNDKKHAEYRGDVYTLAKDAGYEFIRENRAKFDALKPGAGKVWYVASGDAMPNAIDAGSWKDIPTLADLTAKGIELLDNEKGFFLMVEGGRIDWAGHANDAATNLREILALDEAVRVALAFQEKNPDTLVVVTGDHETGGLTMGFEGTGFKLHLERLALQKGSAGCIGDYIAKSHPADFEGLKPFLTENFGFDFTTTDLAKNPMAVTPAELERLQKAFAHDLEMARKGVKENEAYDAAKISRLPTEVKHIFANKCGIQWQSGGHTSTPVLTTAKGPGAERFVGFIENTEISKILKDLLR